jgi:hypothetical protein
VLAIIPSISTMVIDHMLDRQCGRRAIEPRDYLDVPSHHAQPAGSIGSDSYRRNEILASTYKPLEPEVYGVDVR